MKIINKEILSKLLLGVLVTVIVFLFLSFYITTDVCGKYPKPECLDRLVPILFYWLNWY